MNRIIFDRLPENWKHQLRQAKRVVRYFTHRVDETPIPEEELDIFRSIRKECNIVVDVGARMDLTYYDMHPKCEYHLFEPNKRFVRKLKQKAKGLKNVHINAIGLSDADADDCVYYADSQSFVVNPHAGSVDLGHRFSLRTLDGYCKEHGITHIDFLKIDTEGFDHKVLMGGKEILKHTTYLQFEFWDGIRKFLPLLEDFDCYLIMEKGLASGVMKYHAPYSKSVVKLTDELIDIVDHKLAPLGYNGNVFCKRKNDI
jgi:FkbM family methyltransferase